MAILNNQYVESIRSVSPSLGQLAGGAAAIYVTYYVITAIYSITLHPLAAYPGPFFCKFSEWPQFWQTLWGNRAVWTWRLHQRYGDAVRYAPGGLVFNTPQAYEDIYHAKANVRKGGFYEISSRRHNQVNTATITDKVLHARKRRTVNGIFSDNALRHYEHHISSLVDRWIEIVTGDAKPVPGDEKKRGWSQPKNIAVYIDYVIFDILGKLCFGRSFETMEPASKSSLRAMPQHIMDVSMMFMRAGHVPFANLMIYMKPRGINQIMDLFMPDTVRRFFDFTESALVRRRDEELARDAAAREPGAARRAKDQPATHDMFRYIFRARDPESGDIGYTWRELQAETDLLVVAGSDTTSTALSSVVFYLTRNPAAYARLAEEVRAVFPKTEDVKPGPALAGCRFLRAVIDEALRLNPPFGGELPRLVLPGGTRIMGHDVPEGTTVGSALYALHHRPAAFPEPFAFKPERWVLADAADEAAGYAPGASAEAVARAQASFHPFSLGLRGCPARNLAYMEMTAMVARIMVAMDIRLAEGDTTGAGVGKTLEGEGKNWGRGGEGHYQCRDWFISERKGPVVQLRPREAS